VEDFDVEPFRSAGRRLVIRQVRRPTAVLGSTQPATVVDADRVRRAGVEVVRRRSGGAAVLLLPSAQVWADLWVPREDPLWSDEPRASAALVGQWWARALGLDVCAVHVGKSVPRPGSDAVCFAGVGPGEVCVDGRKLVGLAQWRSRQGALVHGCVYRSWDPEPLVGVLAMPEAARGALATALAGAAIGLEELGLSGWPGDEALIEALPDAGSWDVVRA
jgi:lipoate-protein ligase A